MARKSVLVSNIPEMQATLDAHIAPVVAGAARGIEGLAKARAPVDTGDLRDSISAKQVSPLAWKVEAEAWYAGMVESGTTKHPPQPFMVPAAEAVAPGYLIGLKRAIQKAAR